MRIAVINIDRCKPKDCYYLCQRVCPMVKTGKEAIIIDQEKNKPVIVEDLCSGCGICTKKCPFEAITIINLPEELGNPVHQYGINGFRLYNLPTPKNGVVGIIGANGIGKTTVMKILSGEVRPNLGANADWQEIIERFRGKEIRNYLEKLSLGGIKAIYKPQYVDPIPRYMKGSVRDILEKGDETGNLKDIVEKLDLKNSIGKNINELSGGELQRVAITAGLTKNADIYLIDEPSGYLDVRERLNMAKLIREISSEKFVFVVEHDLVVLDYLSDYIHIIFGHPGAYGIISNIKSTRVGINEYLSGFLKSENMRFREEIKFEIRPPSEKKAGEELIEYPELRKSYDGFNLSVESGKLYKDEILGILGPNATGKTTFVKILAGEIEPDNVNPRLSVSELRDHWSRIKIDLNVKVSYKPQYIKSSDKLVLSLKLSPDLIERFGIKFLMERKLSELSGGELQRVAIADCLSRDADIYLLDEPSAYLDVEERLKFAKYIRKFAMDKEVSVLVVDHDILMIDYISDRLMVLIGESGKNGIASNPMGLRDGMNKFLKEIGITFRRDPETGRPRANKLDSVKDREQRGRGEYYYSG